MVSYRLEKQEVRNSDWLLTGNACEKLGNYEHHFSGNFGCSVAQFLVLLGVALLHRE
uniref:Uncharacterized protein n=1 Tax=Anguilla anguilla TaxID=7936 RepID=A0A0E9XE12_ANGAN